MHDFHKHPIHDMTKARTHQPPETDDCDVCLQQISLVTDSRDRLVYIMQQVAHAADRVLDAVESAQPLQNELAVHARELSIQWQRLLADNLLQHANQPALLAVLTQTIGFLDEICKKSSMIQQYLTEIGIAQSHQDLTGQVMQKLLQNFATLEQQLQQYPIGQSIDAKANSAKQGAGLMNGPVIDHTKQPDTLASQDQVDGLLAKLGL